MIHSASFQYRYSTEDSPEKEFFQNDRGTQVTFYFSSISGEKRSQFSKKNPNTLFRRLFTVCLFLIWISRNCLDMLFMRMKKNHSISRFKISSAKSLGFPKILKRRLNLSCKMIIVEHILKILQCSNRKIFKACLTIFHYYTRKDRLVSL